ncbi:MAG: SpoIID/LytB domain-containing protein [Lachnospiraceae bacterium]
MKNRSNYSYQYYDYHKKERRSTLDKVKDLMFLLFLLLILAFAVRTFFGVQKVEEKEYVKSEIYIEVDSFFGKKSIPIEEYLIFLVAKNVPIEYELEMLKVQTILLRTNCMKKIEEKEALKISALSEKEMKLLWGDKYQENYNKIKQAVDETKGMVVTYDNMLIELPFHRISNKETRQYGKSAYLKSVECNKDQESEEYYNTTQIKEREFTSRIEEYTKENEIATLNLILDANDYVSSVVINDIEIDGELFRKEFNIISSTYSIEYKEGFFIITTKGIGHGYGLSQHSANEMAKEGKTYREIIEYFYNEIEIEKKNT